MLYWLSAIVNPSPIHHPNHESENESRVNEPCEESTPSLAADFYRNKNGSLTIPTAPIDLASLWIAAAWLIVITAQIIAVGWLFCDGHSRGCVLAWLHERGLNVALSSSASIQYASPATLRMISWGVVLGSASWFVILTSLLASRHPFRGLKAWMAFMTLTCVALGIVNSWSSIYERGQQRRIGNALPALSVWMSDIARDWPASLSRQPELGPYLSYPTSSAHTVVLMTEPKIPETDLSMIAMEWSSEGTLRMQLAGAERDAWLEHRQDGQKPSTFVNGLGVTYRPTFSAEMERGWFVVRYGL